MSNKVYPKFTQAVLQHVANSSLAGTDATGLYAVLVDAGTYTYNDAHEFYSDLSGVVGAEAQLTSKTFVDGVLDAADVALTSVSGNTAEAIVLFIKNAGANTTWRLVAYLDTGFTGLPVTPDGNNINITWHASGIIGF